MYYYESGVTEFNDPMLGPAKIPVGVDGFNTDGIKFNSDFSKAVFISQTSGITTEITDAQYNSRKDGGVW